MFLCVSTGLPHLRVPPSFPLQVMICFVWYRVQVPKCLPFPHSKSFTLSCQSSCSAKLSSNQHCQYSVRWQVAAIPFMNWEFMMFQIQQPPFACFSLPPTVFGLSCQSCSPAKLLPPLWYHHSIIWQVSSNSFIDLSINSVLNSPLLPTLVYLYFYFSLSLSVQRFTKCACAWKVWGQGVDPFWSLQQRFTQVLTLHLFVVGSVKVVALPVCAFPFLLLSQVKTGAAVPMVEFNLFIFAFVAVIKFSLCSLSWLYILKILPSHFITLQIYVLPNSDVAPY